MPELKTPIRHHIRWATETSKFDGKPRTALQSILATIIPRELVPHSVQGVLQCAEEEVGPYALQDRHLAYANASAPTRLEGVARRDDRLLVGDQPGLATRRLRPVADRQMARGVPVLRTLSVQAVGDAEAPRWGRAARSPRAAIGVS